MSNFVRVPKQDWQNICNSVRGKTGGEALLLSGEVSPAIDGIQSGGGEKILYMDAALLNAGGPYPADADDYTTAVIPADATFVDYEAFDNLPNIDTVIVNGGAEFETYSWYLPNTKSTRTLTALHRAGIKKLVLNNTYIRVLNYHDHLAELEVHNGSTARGALQYCRGLRSVKITDIMYFDANLFAYCDNLRKVELSGDCQINTIGEKSFYNCFSLDDFVIPDGVTAIGASAFYSCRDLKTITIPASVTSIGSSAFYQTAYGTTLTIRGYAGSYAETYAAENGYIFEAIDASNGVEQDGEVLSISENVTTTQNGDVLVIE